jgi:YfiH family protein
MIHEIINSDIFNGHNVKAFFTTKALSGDLKTVSKISGVPLKNIYLPVQKHTNRVMVFDNNFEPGIADAVVTKQKGVLVGVQVADCVPILVYDKEKKVISAVHAGWRGTAAEILKKTIKVFFDKFYSSPSDILIAMGPSIKSCCYGVGNEVIKAVQKVTGKGDYFMTKGGRYCLDLPAANKYQAVSLGIKPENIWESCECTSCLPEKYYSYRYLKDTTGRQYGFIGIV